MKRLLLSTAVILAGLHATAQVVVQGVEPSSISGVTYDYGFQANCGTWPGNTDDGSWGTLASYDFNNNGEHVQDTLMLADTGVPGVDIYGHDSSAYACQPVLNDLTSKIAVVYRGQCAFSTKMFYAQQAGAVAVVIVNREDAIINMAATNAGAPEDGANVLIPGVFLSIIDGDNLVSLMGTTDVELFIGNKFGIYQYDLGSSSESIIIAPQGLTPTALAQNATEFGFTPGIEFVNFGTDGQDVVVTATIDAPGLPNAYNSVVTVTGVNSGDTVSVFDGNPNSFTPFSLAAYPAGEYTLTYSIQGVMGEDAPGDNTFVTTFNMGDNRYSMARQNATTGLGNTTSYPRNHEVSYESCVRFQDANASRLGVDGLHFRFNVDASQTTVDGQEINIVAYEWNDAVTTFSGTATFDALAQLPSGFGQYYTEVADLNQDVYVPFDQQFLLVDNQNYLFCLQTPTQWTSFGYDGGMNYNANLSIYDEVIFPIYIENAAAAQWYSAGWSGQPAPSLTVQMFPAASLGIENVGSLITQAYPNPMNDELNITVNTTGNAKVVATDLAGRVAGEYSVNFTNGTVNMNVSNLTTGAYIFTVTMENGASNQFKVVKK